MKDDGCLYPGIVILIWFGAVFIGMGVLWLVGLYDALPEAWK